MKPKIVESPTDVLKQIIPNVNDDDYHDAIARFLPVLARPLLGLNVNQLFTLMLGKIPADRISQRKPTTVTYSSVFVVDLTNIRCIDDLLADDNGVWCHGGKPRRKYIVELDSDTSEVIKVSPMDEHLDSKEDNILKRHLNFRDICRMLLIVVNRQFSMLLCSIFVMVGKKYMLCYCHMVMPRILLLYTVER